MWRFSIWVILILNIIWPNFKIHRDDMQKLDHYLSHNAPDTMGKRNCAHTFTLVILYVPSLSMNTIFEYIFFIVIQFWFYLFILINQFNSLI